MSQLLETSQICRTCRSKSENTACIFNKYEFETDGTKISDLICLCASVEIFEGDGLPEQICLQCIKEIIRAYAFRKLCEKSDSALRDELTTQVTAENHNVEEDENHVFLEMVNIKLESMKDELAEFTNVPENNLRVEIENDESTDDELKGCVEDANQGIVPDESSGDCKDEHKIYSMGKEHKTGKNTGTLLQDQECDIIHDFNDDKQDLIDDLEEAEDSCSPENGVHAESTGPKQQDNIPPEGQFLCHICSKIFKIRLALQQHLRHHDTKMFLCAFCGKSFRRNSVLTMHLFTHTGEKPFKCDFCSKAFAHVTTLRNHTRIHTGEKRYKCTICGKRFTQCFDRIKHERKHSGEKLYKCNLCGTEYIQAQSLVTHMRSKHTFERPFKCKDCPKSFTCSALLREHAIIHTGQRPHMCNVCGKTYKRKTHLTGHMKHHDS